MNNFRIAASLYLTGWLRASGMCILYWLARAYPTHSCPTALPQCSYTLYAPRFGRHTFSGLFQPRAMATISAQVLAAARPRRSMYGKWHRRLLINVVTGGNMVELVGTGVHLSHDERYAVTDEFLTVWR